MLRKFVLSLAVALAAVAGFAQEPVCETMYETPRVLDNTYVSATVGVNTDAASFGDYVYPELNVYLGKWLTPAFGLELNGEMDCWDSFKTRSCFVKQSYVGIAGMMDIANTFVGYNPDRKLHVIPFVGIGWLHGYRQGPDVNDLATKMGFNLMWDVNKHVSLNLRPTIMYNLTASGATQYNINHAVTGLEIGFTYRFGTFSRKNVVSCDAYAALMDEVNALRARPVERVEVIREVSVTTNTINTTTPENVNVGFTINSADVTYTQLANIATAAAYLKENPGVTAHVHGYADADTGTSEYNLDLSRQRAENVADLLIDMGVDASRISTFYEGSDTQVYPENDWNRAVVIEFSR